MYEQCALELGNIVHMFDILSLSLKIIKYLEEKFEKSDILIITFPFWKAY
jgi:hypothetical protein